MKNGAPRVVEIVVGDEPAAWQAAGFTVEGDACRVGSVSVRLAGEGGGRGIRSWTVTGLDLSGGNDVEGVVTLRADEVPLAGAPSQHANTATMIDHVVLATPDLQRTVAAFEGIGLALRRTRDAGEPQSPMRQAFFRLGEVVLEVVGPPEPTAGGPAKWFGLAFTVADLDALAATVGAHLGALKAAVQPGRQITTLHHRDLGLSVAVAFMDEPAVA
ncbi:MAG: glyoxalase [Acidimicrobiales bacterium]|nr:glyoxalase [Acidimicrobiales bacterium]